MNWQWLHAFKLRHRPENRNPYFNAYVWATGRPRPALASKNQAPAIIEGPARGPAADEGVRPTK
jgi:hypothetical protein